MDPFKFSVKDTNMEALRAKKSAIECGYMRDAFIDYFVPEHVQKEILMHRGYWSRFWCFNAITTKFLKNAKGRVQVLSLGCGLDTMPFNLLRDQAEQKYADFCYFECDLKDVVQQKIDVISKHSDFVGFVKQKSSTEVVFDNSGLTRPAHAPARLELPAVRLRPERCQGTRVEARRRRHGPLVS